MNEQLIKFIELCLVDGVITDKERKVIFRKSKELGVDEDECEIILEGMIHKSSLLKKNNENNSSSLINEDLIENIESLDYQVLSDFIQYIKSVETKLNEVSNSEFINKSFREWYLNLPNNLLIGRTKLWSYHNVPYSVCFYKSREWINEIEEFKPYNEKDLSLKLQHPKKNDEIYIGVKPRSLYNSSFYDILYTTKGVYKVFFTEVKKMFKPTHYLVKTELMESLENIDILDLDNKGVQKSLVSLLRHFDREESIYDSFVKTYKSLDISFNYKNILDFLPDEELFGDDLVVKLSNHIKNLIELLTNQISSIEYKELIPIKEIGNKERGPNPNLYKILEINLLSIKSISNLIQLRNQLLVSIIKKERLKVKFIKEQLDDLGIMLNYYEKMKLEKMDETITVLKNGFNQLLDVFSDLSGNISNLNSTISSGLMEMNESLKFNNLLSTINTYQTYKINKNTKSLRG